MTSDSTFRACFYTKRLHGRHRGTGAKEFVADVANAAPPTAPPPDDSDEDEYVLGRIVRIKHFEAKPMSHEEALAQMDLIGHDFFLFLDSSTNDYALLYKRKDGDHGLLTPGRG